MTCPWLHLPAHTRTHDLSLFDLLRAMARQLTLLSPSYGIKCWHQLPRLHKICLSLPTTPALAPALTQLCCTLMLFHMMRSVASLNVMVKFVVPRLSLIMTSPTQYWQSIGTMDLNGWFTWQLVTCPCGQSTLFFNGMLSYLSKSSEYFPDAYSAIC